MKITEDVKTFAAEHGTAEDQAIQADMEQKAQEFVEKRGELTRKREDDSPAADDRARAKL